MADVHEEARRRILQSLIAALIVSPLEPALTEAELEEVVVASGISIAVHRELAAETRYASGDKPGRRTLGADDLMTMLFLGGGHYPVALFPRAPIGALSAAFDELDSEYGKKHPKTLAVLIAKCAPQLPASVELALGMAIVLGFVKRAEDGFVRDGDLEDLFVEPRTSEPHPWVPEIRSLLPLVESVMAKRAGTQVPAMPPVDRFHRFLVKQSWSEFATWWALTSREMESAAQHHPTATTVLAGALLEAALVAIAGPAQADGLWRRKFLNDPPEAWKVGQLIEQAEAAGTLSSADASLARTVTELRNRIHAGKYASTVQGPFRPPSTNSHDAKLARLNLERVLDVILGWPPVVARS